MEYLITNIKLFGFIGFQSFVLTSVILYLHLKSHYVPLTSTVYVHQLVSQYFCLAMCASSA